ncbi:MAG: flavodoxin [Firmicutes bacterium]|nr:flavodoxin [Bacillota bacterium]
MKKFIMNLIKTGMLLSLVACSSQPAVKKQVSEEEEVVQVEKLDGEKIAVVYFSATGNTKEVAIKLSEELDADLYEIVPSVAYTEEDINYTDDACRANREMNDESSRPEFEEIPEVEKYSTILLGYPIWWGTAPRIIQTFLETYPLENTKIYTFCTSGGSGIEQSLKDLQGLYPEKKIVNGKRFGSSSKEEVKEYLQEIE